MKYALCLLLLFACAQAPLEPVIAPPIVTVFTHCDAVRVVGEGCTDTCECLRPGSCLNGICSLTKLPDGGLCVQNKQCSSGYCTESGRCGGPDGPKVNYDCDKVCRTDYTGKNYDCHTVCKYR